MNRSRIGDQLQPPATGTGTTKGRAAGSIAARTPDTHPLPTTTTSHEHDAIYIYIYTHTNTHEYITYIYTHVNMRHDNYRNT